MDGSMMTTMMTFGVVILIFYFLIIRPQKKKDKEAKAMLAAMKKGDRVISIGGIHGTIITVKENTVVVKVDDNARIEFTKSAIASVVTKTAQKPVKKEEKVLTEEKKEEKAVETEEVKTENPAETEKEEVKATEEK